MLRLQQWQILSPKSTVTGKEVQVWFLWSRFNQFFPSSCYTLLFVVMMMKARHNCDWAFALCSCKVILPPSFSPWDWYLGTASRTVTLCRWWWWLEQDELMQEIASIILRMSFGGGWPTNDLFGSDKNTVYDQATNIIQIYSEGAYVTQRQTGSYL